MRLVILKFPYTEPKFCERLCEMAQCLGYDIAAVISLEKNFSTSSINGHEVLPLIRIYDFSWDAAILACDTKIFNDTVARMVELKIGTSDQFKSTLWILKPFMIAKYEDCADPAIRATIDYWQTHELSVFNQYFDEARGTLDKIFFDETCNLPYIYFKTVGSEYPRMYFPQSTEFTVYNDEKFFANLMQEQLPNSPHLYTKGDHQVKAGDVLIDAGVAEGNFALRYVDICSKIFLFEPNPRWLEPLNQTFKNFRDKVEIIPRYVSNVTVGDFITIDDALPDLRGENIFLKMDVEGAEPFALRGAEKILTNNRVRASVCTYHNADDLVKVKSILRRYGFKTSTSDGYMVFYHDPNILYTADFRKGVVYAAN